MPSLQAVAITLHQQTFATSSKLPKDCQANAHVTYSVDKHHMDKPGSLIDRGANGGVAGADVRVIASTHRAVNVQGISEHQVTDLKIVTAGGVVQTQRGPVITTFNQYAHIGMGKTIHSSVQLEEFGLEVNEKSVRLPGGLQHIKMPDGYVLPIQIKDGLPYVALRPYTDDEWETLPHIHLTRDLDWDPAVFNGGTDVGVCTRHPRQIEMDESRLHFQARQVKPGELLWMGQCLRSLLVGRHHQRKWWLLSRSWGPSSMKPGAITIHWKEAYGGS